MSLRPLIEYVFKFVNMGRMPIFLYELHNVIYQNPSIKLSALILPGRFPLQVLIQAHESAVPLSKLWVLNMFDIQIYSIVKMSRIW